MSALSDGARLVLLELEAPPSTPASSAMLAETLIGLSSREIGAYMRELRAAGLVEPLDAQTLEPLERVDAGRRVVWRPTR